MKKQDKIALVGDLTEKISKANALYLANYKGLTYHELNNIRQALKEMGNDFRVVKNRLLKIALKNNNIENLDEILVDQTAIAIVFDEPTTAAKEFKKFNKEYKNFEIKGGYLDGQALSKEDVIALADIPSREELLARMLGSMSAPARNFVSLLANIPRSLLNVLNAIKEKKENN
ncbi:50S ribosomal protein L10 [Deferribacter desulfuricans SSM1]|uniref:Large ribosomal subunit protein uL10 n=1 Tax=Deferribacter desulfuricans (strain DSM 14783 / JCM 11476 / NBRC 101012 / SSM1) TaxID=639282 RepID=D3P946_DEFDS|nr:50S ribosomal protein L10 [Deferribacter desulfuricans]BAI81236.1 50S ribosomal protein L10 [Deferribacter desulfuricans SSM1]